MHNPTRSLFCVLILILANLESAPAEATSESGDRQLSRTVPEIVHRSIAHHGGELYSRSQTELDICSKSGCFRIGARIEGDRFELEATGQTREGEQFARIDNESVERHIDNQPRPVPADQEQALRDWVMARIYFCFLPYRLTDPSVRFRDFGLETWPDGQGGHRQLHKIEVGFEAGTSTDDDDQYLYWFDPETARLEQFAYSYSGNPGGLRFRSLFDHRRIGGLLFFDQKNSGVESPSPEVLDITPSFVEGMRSISTVSLKNIRVTPLPDSGDGS